MALRREIYIEAASALSHLMQVIVQDFPYWTRVISPDWAHCK
jgi:hypothetical protein